MNRLLLAVFYFGSLQSLLLPNEASSLGQENPTEGFISLPFNSSYYHIQRPYNIPLNQRYLFENGVHRLWVFANDKPHSPTSHTKPRTEIAVQGYTYSSGVWQFEGLGYVPHGTTGVCIMQVFGADAPHASTFMLQVHNGALMYYRRSVIARDMYERWFKLNVVHDVSESNSKVKVYIDGQLKLEAPGRGGNSHTFKCGVYAQIGDSIQMESRWKDIKILKKM